MSSRAVAWLFVDRRMSTHRRLIVAIVAIGAGVLIVPLRTIAQQATSKMRRIGFMSLDSASENASRIDGLRAGRRWQKPVWVPSP